MARSQQAVLAAVMAWRCSGSVRASYDADHTDETTQAAIFLYRSRLRRQHANPEVSDVDFTKTLLLGFQFLYGDYGNVNTTLGDPTRIQIIARQRMKTTA